MLLLKDARVLLIKRNVPVGPPYLILMRIRLINIKIFAVLSDDDRFLFQYSSFFGVVFDQIAPRVPDQLSESGEKSGIGGWPAVCQSTDSFVLAARAHVHVMLVV